MDAGMECILPCCMLEWNAAGMNAGMQASYWLNSNKLGHQKE